MPNARQTEINQSTGDFTIEYLRLVIALLVPIALTSGARSRDLKMF
jgi:hypothetical protein